MHVIIIRVSTVDDVNLSEVSTTTPVTVPSDIEVCDFIVFCCLVSTRGIQKVRRPTQLKSTRYADHIL